MMFSYRGGAFGEAAEPNIFYILGSAACHMVISMLRWNCLQD
jgi:hypothetical protein